MSSLNLAEKLHPAGGGSPEEGDSEHGYFNQQSFNVVTNQFHIEACDGQRMRLQCNTVHCGSRLS